MGNIDFHFILWLITKSMEVMGLSVGLAGLSVQLFM